MKKSISGILISFMLLTSFKVDKHIEKIKYSDEKVIRFKIFNEMNEKIYVYVKTSKNQEIDFNLLHHSNKEVYLATSNLNELNKPSIWIDMWVNGIKTNWVGSENKNVVIKSINCYKDYCTVSMDVKEQ